VAITRPEGLILIGEGYWRRLPDQVYLDFLGATEEELLTHSGNIEAGREAGLMPLYSCLSDENDWDDYEESYHANVLRILTLLRWTRIEPPCLSGSLLGTDTIFCTEERRLASGYICLESRSRTPSTIRRSTTG
jgi:hypothetical protein